MKTIIENVIKTGRYELKDMLTKLDTAWYQGQISYDERNELTDLARENATPEMGYADINERMKRIEERVAALEAKVNADTYVDEYPEYKQPTGAHDAYKAGDKVTYKGVRYVCVAPSEYAVSYPPDVMPDYWKVVNN